jgi:hypothetical protein
MLTLRFFKNGTFGIVYGFMSGLNMCEIEFEKIYFKILNHSSDDFFSTV